MRKRKVISLFTLSILHTAEARIAESVEARVSEISIVPPNVLYSLSPLIDPSV
jgi:hypothetical protein